MAKVDFACRNFELFEVVRCALGLTKGETKVFRYFLESSGWESTKQVSEDLGLDLSTVQRAVKKLYGKGVLKRFQQNLDNGGYQFVYQSRDSGEVKEEIMSVINSWVDRVDEELASL